MGNEERCFLCYQIIPEGRQLCPQCWERVMHNGNRENGSGENCGMEKGRIQQSANHPKRGGLLHRLALRLGIKR